MRKLCGIFLFLAVLAVVHAAEPFAKGRFVLLSGVPGDVESNRLYQRQLFAMLDVLAETGVRPADVHILLHDPAHFELPEKWKGAEVAAGTRENFLALGPKFGEVAEPVNVIVWGHGGMMRDEAVFHVSGPRLTANDFKAFADAASHFGAPSRWVMFFVGSGAISQALPDGNRQVLASENATRFTSDPVGLDIFIDAWAKQPTASFEALARAAGPLIASRYSSRKLARTEEPTLLLSGQPPLLLADLEAGDATEAPAKDASALPERWQSIKRVDPKDYPRSDAVVLNRTIRYTLGDDPAVDEEIEEYVQILTAEGKGRGDFELSFSPPAEDLTFAALEVLSPSGKLQTFDPENVLEQKSQEVEGYDRGGRKMFSLPALEPGSIIHTHYRRVWKRFPFPYIFHSVPVGDDIPVLRSSLQVEVPKARTLHYDTRNTPEAEPTITESNYGRVAKWEWQNLPPSADEILTEPGGGPALQISTFPDWKSFNDWYQRLTREADTITDEIREKTKEVTKDCKTPQEKVKALYEFVTGMRYISIPLGVNSFRPHAAERVLQNRFGDCKDKANLLNTMLRAAGFQAQLVLVPRFSQANEKVPGLSFNHAISRVELPDGPMWLDATDDVCPFGMLPPGDSGRNVLVVGGENKLTRLPVPSAASHSFDLEVAIDPKDGFASRAALTAQGFAGYTFRETVRKTDGTNGTMPFLGAAGLAFTNGIFVTDHDSHTPVGTLDGDFKWQAEGHWTGVVVTGKTFLPPFALPQTWSHAMQKRTRELVPNNGYPLDMKQTLRLRWPSRIAALPAPQEQTTGPLRWRLAWKQDDKDLVGLLEISLPQARLDGEQVTLFQREFARLSEALATPLSLSAKQ